LGLIKLLYQDHTVCAIEKKLFGESGAPHLETRRPSEGLLTNQKGWTKKEKELEGSLINCQLCSVA